jgi:hypothetical protein
MSKKKINKLQWKFGKFQFSSSERRNEDAAFKAICGIHEIIKLKRRKRRKTMGKNGNPNKEEFRISWEKAKSNRSHCGTCKGIIQLNAPRLKEPFLYLGRWGWVYHCMYCAPVVFRAKGLRYFGPNDPQPLYAEKGRFFHWKRMMTLEV